MKARYKAIVDKFAEMIRSGKILPGSRLPTHRNLSAQEHISLATATRVYSELEAMGLVSGETGRGRLSGKFRCLMSMVLTSMPWQRTFWT